MTAAARWRLLSPWRRVAAALLSLLVLATLAWAAWTALAQHRAAVEGARLFDGQTALDAQIRGHADRLPGAATRCANCHASAPLRQAALRTGLAPEAFAPLIDADQLLTARSRRGGPPSRYDPGSFCRVLRTGIDPAHVLLPRDMPRYALSDLQCRQLWAHLTQ